MAKKKKTGKIKRKLLHKYRLVVLNEDTFEERFSFKLNRLNVFVFSTILAIFLIGTTILIIAFTPMREYIPGYSSTALKKKATQLTYRTDSLEYQLAVNQKYLQSIQKVLLGDVKMEDFNKDSIIKAASKELADLDFVPSKVDSLMRDKVYREDKYNPLLESAETNFVLLAPVKGTISEEYEPKIKHYAIDVVTQKNAPVKAVADGTVIFSGWTTDNGYVIIIDHGNNLISAYKHNSYLSKEQGDLIKAGEVIAIVGNTGKLTTGPHLHFELWSNGFPINPKNFIDFD